MNTLKFVRESEIPAGTRYIRLCKGALRSYGDFGYGPVFGGRHTGAVLIATEDGTGRSGVTDSDSGVVCSVEFADAEGLSLGWTQMKEWAAERAGTGWMFTYWIDGVNCK